MAQHVAQIVEGAEQGPASTQGGVEEIGAHGEVIEHSTGLPQLDLGTFPNQIFWLLVALVAIYFILDRIALPRIAGVIGERQGTITNDIAAAEDLKAKAKTAEETYEKALADARAESQAIAQEARDEMQAEVDRAMADADARIGEKTAESERRIDEIRASAASAVDEVAREVAREIVALISGSADPAAVDAAVSERTKT